MYKVKYYSLVLCDTVEHSTPPLKLSKIAHQHFVDRFYTTGDGSHIFSSEPLSKTGY